MTIVAIHPTLYLTADHLPVCIEIAFQRVPEFETVNEINHPRIAWDKINQAGKNEYSTVTESNLQSVHIPYEALSCKEVACTNVTHRNDISKFYNDIVQVLCEGGDVVSNNRAYILS